jgi:cytochrome c oxidase subunit 2
MAMTLPDDTAIRNVAAYIEALPDQPSQTTVTGDINNGQDIYDRNCAACHLDDGSGTWYTDAPVLAGMDDWYFVTQISNFLAGIRGKHPNDHFGEQMSLMATAISGLEEINDVAAYINTLR